MGLPSIPWQYAAYFMSPHILNPLAFLERVPALHMARKAVLILQLSLNKSELRLTQ